jgi:methenyltetrahydrofolate cyclohydrolase
MNSYSRMTVTDLLDAFAANTPVPGGGSAAALAAALGVSLLVMVAGLPRTRTNALKEKEDLAQSAARLRPLANLLLELVDRDSEAYRSVIAAYRLPKDTTDRAEARRGAIQAAMQAATEPPLHTMRTCRQALVEAAIVADCGVPSARSDVGVALELLMAAVRGAGLNVDANLSHVSDNAFVDRVRVERRRLEVESAGDAERARRYGRETGKGEEEGGEEEGLS